MFILLITIPYINRPSHLADATVATSIELVYIIYPKRPNLKENNCSFSCFSGILNLQMFAIGRGLLSYLPAQTSERNTAKCLRRYKNKEVAMRWFPRGHIQTVGYHVPKFSPARNRRSASYAQRKAANIREQRRMMNMKDAFRSLKECLPVLSYKKRMSRIETLRLAIVYIKFLEKMIKDETASSAEGCVSDCGNTLNDRGMFENKTKSTTKEF